jgi:hypothetical protein
MINRQLEPIEEWIEKWGAELSVVAQVKLRIAVIEAIEERIKTMWWILPVLSV